MKLKRIIAVLTLLCMVACMLPPMQTNAATEDDYTCEVVDGQATITGYTGAGGKITIPSTLGGYPVTTIGDYAFQYCYSLTSVAIPDSVTTIGGSAFSYCDSLTSVVIGDSVTTIGEYAFDSCTKLTSVEIGDSVTGIGDYAFYYCTSLTSVVIPDSVTTIGDAAFFSCESLTGIWVDQGNPNYSSDDKGVLFNKDKTVLIQAPGAISGSYTIPDSVFTIGDFAFYPCRSLTSVEIPDSVTTIGDGAFSYCCSLTSVVIPDSVTTIGYSAFSSCDSLTGIWVDQGNPNYSSDDKGVLFNKDKTVLIQAPGAISGSYTIPDSVTTIGDYAFSYSGLISVEIPDSVTTIGNSAFAYCDSLTGIWVDENNPNYSSDSYGVLFNKDKTRLVHVPRGISGAYVIPDSVTTIGDSAFSYCCSLTSVVIPDSVTTIGNSAFSDCDSLTSVVIGDSVTTIDDWAFSYCDSLTSVVIGNSVTTIGNWAFAHCDSLTSVVIGDSVTTIGDYAFYDCYSLTSVAIPDSVTTIGDGAFWNCSSLTSVTYCGTEEQWDEIVIGVDDEPLMNAQRQYHDYVDGVCSICGHTTEPAVHVHTWENGACTGCEQVLAEAIELSGDGKISAFDAQILAEAQAGLRTLTDEQWQALGALKVSDIIDYILGRFPGMKTEE